MTIRIILTSYNCGCDEAQFDEWCTFVSENIEYGVGIKGIDVEAFYYGGSEQCDVVKGASYNEEEMIRRWLNYDGWNAFCAG